MKLFSTLTLRFVFVLGAAHTIFADPLQWDLSTLTYSGTSFPSGVVSTGTVTGSITYDANTNVYTTWTLDLSGFPGTGVPASGLLLTPANISTFCGAFCATEFGIVDSTQSTEFGFFDLVFSQALTDAGGTVRINYSDLALNTPNFGSFLLQSVGSASAVPEPSSAALTLIVSIGFGTLFLRQLRHSRPKQ